MKITRLDFSFVLVALLLLGTSTMSPARSLQYYTPYVFPEWASEREEQFVYLYARCEHPFVAFGEPVLKRATPNSAEGHHYLLEMKSPSGEVCFGGEPITVFAVRIPREIRAVGTLLGTKLIYHSGLSPTGEVRIFDTDVSWSTSYFSPVRPLEPRDIPPSVGGTWYDPAFPAQGLLLTLAREGLVVSWNTFDAQGAPIWLTGLARQRGNHTARGELFSTRGGVFAGAPATPPAQPTWGEIEVEYLACGRLRVKWQPIDTQAYRSGETEMRQLTSTGAHGGCSIQELAGSLYKLTIVDPILQLD